MKPFILSTLAFLSIIFVVGSVGAYQNNTIGFGQLILQVGIAALIEWLSLKSLSKI